MMSGNPGLGVIPQRGGRQSILCLVGQGPLTNVRLRVTQDRVHVGRSDPSEGITVDLDLGPYEASLPMRALSRRHAEIARTDAGWSVVDLQSSNGTYLDDRRLKPGEPSPLAPGCLVRFGQLSFLVEEER